MISVIINDINHDLADVNPSWVHEQINARESDGVPVCVRIIIKEPGVDIALSCGNCGSSGGGGGRRPNSEEERILSIWEKFDLKDAPINSGKLIAFLQQIKN